MASLASGKRRAQAATWAWAGKASSRLGLIWPDAVLAIPDHPFRSDGSPSFSPEQKSEPPPFSRNPSSFSLSLFRISRSSQPPDLAHRGGEHAPGDGGAVVVPCAGARARRTRTSQLLLFPFYSLSSPLSAPQPNERQTGGGGATTAPLAGARVRPEPRAAPSRGTVMVPFGPSRRPHEGGTSLLD
jgi:hypothetical protein